MKYRSKLIKQTQLLTKALFPESDESGSSSEDDFIQGKFLSNSNKISKLIT